jgi:hypothetical protein
MGEMRRPLPLLLLALALVALALAGCGGGGGGDSTATTATEVSAGPPAAAFHPKPHHDSGGGAGQFTVKGADNSVQEFGAEADEAELRAAATVLHGFLDARAARNWAAACDYLSKATKQSFGQLSAASEQPAGCAASLAALSGKVSITTLREAAVADVGSLRAEGGQAFLIYSGAPKGTVYAISMSREGGAWKVASLSGVPLS